MAFIGSYPDLLTNIVAGVLIIVFGIIGGNILSIVTKKIFNSFELNRILQDIGMKFPVAELLQSLIKYGFYLGGLLLGLTFLGLEKTVLLIVLFIILALLILFILLAFKDFIPNLFAGLVIYFKRKIRQGEVIGIETIEGKVIHMDMLEIKLRTTDGDVIVMPNVLVFNSTIIRKKKGL